MDCLGQVIYRLCIPGRAPRTKETLLDFQEWIRVTRHPLVFRGLTGSQRTPGFWGVTLTEVEICVQVPGSRSGYVKGLGHGPRPPPSSSRSRHAKSHREIKLENELKATRELI